MSYVPNALDPTEPVESRFVESAALEFRTMKPYIVRTLFFPAADAPGNRAELPTAANRAGRFLAFDSITAQPIPGPLLTAWTITQSQILAIETVANNIVAVDNVSDHMADILAALAVLPDLADKVSKTSGTGSAVIPAGTTAQRDSVPAEGYTRFNEDTDQLEVYKSTGWAAVGAGASGGVNNPMFYENDQVMAADYTIPGTKNADTTGPISINPGVTLTVDVGATLVIH